MQYRKIKIKEKISKIESLTKDSLLDELLALKNITKKEDVEKFLNPTKKDFISPYAFKDMQKSVERVKNAIEKQEKILIWGDFDCDGVTSTSILFKALTYLKANLSTFIPDRLLHGHGLNTKELLKLVSKERVKLVITVDCGITNIAEVNLLKSLGVDTIITDHHTTDIELPNAYAIINAQVKGALSEVLSVEDILSLTYNSGSVVAYKLAMALLEKEDCPKLKDELLVIASMGAIADVVPLIGENRAMVTIALELLNNQHTPKGIYKLLSKNIKDRLITSYDAAFVLAPRINAVGRLSNAKLSFDFLTSDDDNKLDIIIEKLDNYNTIRQSKCAETYEEIINLLKNDEQERKNPAVVLINPDWHIGIIGIVASKIAEEFNKPCFLMTIDENNFARCSIRSNDLVNVYSVLKENEAFFKGFGGHKGAGGCSFDLNETNFEEVKKALNKTVSELIDKKAFDDTLYADIELKSDDINLNILDSINRLEPFGQGNEPPLFAMFNVNLDEFKLIGKEQNHLRLVFSKDDKKFQCVKWGENEINIPLNSKCDIAFYPRINTFNDIKSVQLEIVDVYSAAAAKKSGIKLFDHRKKTGILDSIASYLERKELDIAVWAKKPSTKEKLSEYSQIKECFYVDNTHKGLMFFDYPSTKEEFGTIIETIQPQKIHLMNYQIDENIENFIKQLSGMLKYCSNKLNGQIDLIRMAQTLGTSEKFVQLALDIFDEINSIKILDIDKIEYIKAVSFEEFKAAQTYNELMEEFSRVVEFKKELLEADIKEVEGLIAR